MNSNAQMFLARSVQQSMNNSAIQSQSSSVKLNIRQFVAVEEEVPVIALEDLAAPVVTVQRKNMGMERGLQMNRNRPQDQAELMDPLAAERVAVALVVGHGEVQAVVEEVVAVVTLSTEDPVMEEEVCSHLL